MNCYLFTNTLRDGHNIKFYYDKHPDMPKVRCSTIISEKLILIFVGSLKKLEGGCVGFQNPILNIGPSLRSEIDMSLQKDTNS